MGEEKEDRRVVRTRQLLRDALVSLILERGYDEVTVQDVLDRANLGRSTFYAHYRNKDDLLFSGFEQFAAGLHARAHEIREMVPWASASISSVTWRRCAACSKPSGDIREAERS